MARSMQVDLQLNIDNARRQLNQFNQDAQKAFKSSGASSPQYQQAAQIAAQQRVTYRDALAQQTAYNRSLQEEAKLRQQNMQAAQRAAQQTQARNQEISRQFSPAAQTLAGVVPGGGILTSGLGGGGMAALAAASAVAAGVAAVTAEFSHLGDRARELASTSSNAATQLGQLRTSMERNKISSDIAATSPAVTGFQKFVSDVGTNIDDFFSHLSSPQDRAGALKEKLSMGLGQGNEDWRRLKEQGTDLEQDIGIARQAMQVKWQRSERDFALEQRKFSVDTQNQIFDLQKQAQRTQFDQQIAVQKFQENFQAQQSQKAYDLSRQFASMSFQVNQSRSYQDFALNRQDQNTDFSLQMSRSKEDRQRQLQDMALGGATGLDYFRAARDFNVQMSRAQQDFQIQQGREARNFGISQQRAGQDYAMQTAQAQASRQLELEAQEYSRRYEGLELQTQINRQSQDLAINFQRLNQSIGFQKQAFANQASDMAYDKNLDYSNFALQTSRQRRNYGYALDSFAAAARDKDPLGALGLAQKDPTFAAFLNANAQRNGLPSLQSQVQAAMNQSDNSPGGQLGKDVQDAKNTWNAGNMGDAIGAMQRLGDFFKWLNSVKNGGGSKQSSGNNPSIQLGNQTFNFNPGMSDQDQQAIQTIVDQGNNDTMNKILDLLRRTYGG